MTLFSRGRMAFVGIAVAATLLSPVASATPARASDTLQLPGPTGPHAVGATDVHLKDTSRPDPWVPEVEARELMVTVWYPTNARHGARTQYMTPEESKLYVEGKRIPDVAPDVLSTVRTHAYADAKPAGRRLPLVVLSPGHTQPRAFLTGLAEDLASHGYVVAVIDHTYETYAVTFPDGRIAPCAACLVDGPSSFRAKQHQVRAADVSFVIDSLTGPRAAWSGARLIDASRIGASGHSSGGASAIPAMLSDTRIDVGVNMDGTTSKAIPATGLSRPFVFLGAPPHVPGGPDESWNVDWSLMTGWKRWLVVDGAVHGSFHDAAVLAEQLGIPSGATITGTRSMEITRRYNRAVFDLHLRHRPQPLLETASSRYPEVAIAAR
ncbi:alpha/beta hydrolase family protein [Micromonospora sp. CPCC 206061]|uniref:alpha/beta hydrolase family protein n=1 Tax=Micromonospora sp. CPCC 206061 TaxID=3122410 RepID=UPI002FF209F3